jgi:hypothetical protein
MAKRNAIALNLIQKIRRKKAKVAVLGLGYVGLPMAREIPIRSESKPLNEDRRLFLIYQTKSFA